MISKIIKYQDKSNLISDTVWVAFLVELIKANPTLES
jgi:hypothetical protein